MDASKPNRNSGGIAPLVLNFGIRCKGVVSFRPRPLQSEAKTLEPLWAAEPFETFAPTGVWKLHFTVHSPATVALCCRLLQLLTVRSGVLFPKLTLAHPSKILQQFMEACSKYFPVVPNLSHMYPITLSAHCISSGSNKLVSYNQCHIS